MNRRRILSGIGLLVLIGVIAPFVVYGFPGLIGADQSYVVMSDSMEPAISAGDAVVVNSVPPAKISEGDVITFRVNNEPLPTTHRVVDVQKRDGTLTFQTKGDANEEIDESQVPASSVIGRVMITLPYLGYVIQFADSPLGYLTLIGVPFGLLVFSEAWSLSKPLRNGSEAASAGEASDEDASDEDAPDGSKTTEPADGDATENTWTMTRADLKSSLVVLTAFSVYAWWLASQALGDFLRVSVAVAVTLLTLFAGIVYVAGDGDDADGPTDSDGVTIETVPNSDFPADDGVFVGSVQALVEIASTAEGSILVDEQMTRYQLTVDDTVYYFNQFERPDPDEGFEPSHPTPDAAGGRSDEGETS